MGHLLDFLSEMLIIQKNSIQLMTLARDRATTPDVREWMAKFVENLEHRTDQLRTVVRDLGGNPVFVSPAAQLQHQRTQVSMEIPVPSRLQALSDIENCWYSAVQENVHLAFLRSVIPYLDSTHAQDLLDDMLSEIAQEQADRLEWLEQTLHRLLLQRAIMPTNGPTNGNDWYHAA